METRIIMAETDKIDISDFTVTSIDKNSDLNRLYIAMKKEIIGGVIGKNAEVDLNDGTLYESREYLAMDLSDHIGKQAYHSIWTKK